MISKSMISGLAMACAVLTSSTAWACDAAGKSTHIGSLMTVNAEQSTFTIQDAQSRSPITFTADKEIMEGLKGASGSVMVNYMEEGDTLKAVGVTF
ncbi:MAG: hypothetical protein LJE85_13395 [Gammaproteobacteria bacterium]|jgi:hypothetical protein|nr:hypothetical protein [Gammaproteobacteria bacterium]